MPRFDQAHRDTDKLLAEMERKLERVYSQAEQETREKLTEYLRKFALKDKQKRAQLAAGEITKADYNYWRTGQIAIGERWNEMIETLAQDYGNRRKIADSIINGYKPEVYALNHNYATYKAEKDALVDTSYTLYSRETVERLMRDNPDMLPPPGKRVSKEIAEDRAQLWDKQVIQGAMTQGILQGETIPEIAKRLATAVSDSNFTAAIRNARTMTTGAENAGRVDALNRARSMGIKVKDQWLATLDSRTRDSHRRMDGEIREDPEKPFSNGCMFPGDPHGLPAEVYNCRCTIIGAVDGYDSSVSDVSTRDNKLNGMPYEEWKTARQKKAESTKIEEGTQKADKQKETPPEETHEEKIKRLLREENPDIYEVGREYAAMVKEEKYGDTRDMEKFEAAQKKVDETGDIIEELRNIQDIYANFGDLYDKNDLEALSIMYPQYKDMMEKANAIVLKAKSDYMAGSAFVWDVDEAKRKAQDIFDEYEKTIWARRREYQAERDKYDTREPAWEFQKKMLSKFRETGYNDKKAVKEHFSNSRSPAVKYLAKAYECYPRKWAETSVNYSSLLTGMVERGYYQHGVGIYLSGRDEKHIQACAFHELGHRFENVIEEIAKEEREFYDRRTEGYEVVPLGMAYNKDEVTRRDKFIDPYIGKEYGLKGTAIDYSFELVSMGFQYAYSEPETLAKDPDMEAWIYGLLLTK